MPAIVSVRKCFEKYFIKFNIAKVGHSFIFDNMSVKDAC